MNFFPQNPFNLFNSNTKKARHHKHRKTMKKMNCSPAVKGKTIDKETCYTKDILFKIRDAYNKGHKSDEKIISKNPKVIWNTLRERLVKCEKEDCWLSELTDAILRKEIEDYIFAPDQPPEWKTNKNEWLSNIDISKVMKQYEHTYKKFKFIGPTPIDFATRVPEHGGKCVWEELCNLSIQKLLNQGKTKIGITFNLDDHNGPGSHWVSMFIDLDDKYVFYYDSAGNDIPKEINDLRKEIIHQARNLPHRKIKMRFYKNYPVEHQQGNTECGMYSLFFIITMLTAEVEGKSKISLAKKIKMFKGGKIPDSYVEKYRNVYFNYE
jgi:Ulp1 protease family, C-terminal catalytic domain/Vaccinia virus I7 processing peptidase